MKKHSVRWALQNAKDYEAWFKEQEELRKTEEQIISAGGLSSAMSSEEGRQKLAEAMSAGIREEMAREGWARRILPIKKVT